jgi:hypothetical protein
MTPPSASGSDSCDVYLDLRGSKILDALERIYDPQTATYTKREVSLESPRQATMIDVKQST